MGSDVFLGGDHAIIRACARAMGYTGIADIQGPTPRLEVTVQEGGKTKQVEYDPLNEGGQAFALMLKFPLVAVRALVSDYRKGAEGFAERAPRVICESVAEHYKKGPVVHRQGTIPPVTMRNAFEWRNKPISMAVIVNGRRVGSHVIDAELCGRMESALGDLVEECRILGMESNEYVKHARHTLEDIAQGEMLHMEPHRGFVVSR